MKARLAWLAMKIVLGAALSALSACAHKDLVAPCTRDSSFRSFGIAFAAASDCGPLLPINR